MAELSKENAREVNFFGQHIDRIIEQLLEYQAKGESVYTDFNGVILYSADISVDGAYQAIFGMTKNEYDIKKEEEQKIAREREKKIKAQKAKEQEEKLKRAKKNMPQWIKRLKDIKKEELDERIFYKQVLSIIGEMGNIYLDSELQEELRTTLREIGCKEYKDWKEEKELNGEEIVDITIEEGIESGDVRAAVSMISQLLYDGDSNFGLEYMLQGGEYGWLQEWISKSEWITKFNQSKSTALYYQIARQVLIERDGLSEEEVEKIISSAEYAGSIERKGGTPIYIPVMFAIEGIGHNLDLTRDDAIDLKGFVLHNEPSAVIESWRSMIASQDSSLGLEGEYNAKANREFFDDLIMKTLVYVHDRWVRNNNESFLFSDEKYKYMPIELLGWERAKADLIYIRPIFEAAGVEVSEERLEQLYNKRVREFFLDNKIATKSDLSDAICKGAEFYPALKHYRESDLESLSNCSSIVASSIEEQGIGRIEDVRKDIISHIIEHPEPRNIVRLLPEEQSIVEESISHDIETLSSQSVELEEKNSVIKRIMALAYERRKIKFKLKTEEEKMKQNIKSLDD